MFSSPLDTTIVSAGNQFFEKKNKNIWIFLFLLFKKNSILLLWDVSSCLYLSPLRSAVAIWYP